MALRARLALARLIKWPLMSRNPQIEISSILAYQEGGFVSSGHCYTPMIGRLRLYCLRGRTDQGRPRGRAATEQANG